MKVTPQAVTLLLSRLKRDSDMCSAKVLVCTSLIKSHLQQQLQAVLLVAAVRRLFVSACSGRHVLTCCCAAVVRHGARQQPQLGQFLRREFQGNSPSDSRLHDFGFARAA
jgi:hypothetical protein